ncbi:MAG TPA: proton-conducting transporter membrane subunit, partial [Pseudoxanthomonas sp.]|nr:proton-conducting transporter membrane subunit [Pseudoxanthomonas sp.]
LGALAGRTLRGTVSYLVIASAATLFIGFALQTPAAVSAGLYYLVHSTFVTAALFLIADLVRRQRGATGDRLERPAPMGARTLLGVLFLIGAVSVAGLPPLSGFVGKLMLLAAAPAPLTASVWTAILATSLMMVVALSRVGSQVFWRAGRYPERDAPPQPTRIETAAAMLLIGYGVALALAAGPVLRYTQAAGEQILAPAQYIEQVRATEPRLRAPSP